MNGKVSGLVQVVPARVLVCPELVQMYAVVLPDGWRVLVEGIEDADGVGLVGQLGDVCLGGPAEGGCLVAGAPWFGSITGTYRAREPRSAL
jgi:hypothetical protein